MTTADETARRLADRLEALSVRVAELIAAKVQAAAGIDPATTDAA